MTWRLRAASPGDCDALALVGSASFLESFAGILAGDAIVAHCRHEHAAVAYERFFDTGAKAWLVEAEAGQAPIGYALLAAASLPGSRGDRRDIELKRIYVLSRFHGQGIGAALMGQALGAARARGAERVMLGVYAANDKARAFYARQGFVHVGERRCRVGDREYDDVVLARSVI